LDADGKTRFPNKKVTGSAVFEFFNEQKQRIRLLLVHQQLTFVTGTTKQNTYLCDLEIVGCEMEILF
jgi:hypothetical protein